MPPLTDSFPSAAAAYNPTMPALIPLAALPPAALPALPGPGMRVLKAKPKAKALTTAELWALTESTSGTDAPGEPAGDDEEMYEDATGDTTGDGPADDWVTDEHADGDEFMEELHFVEEPPPGQPRPASPSLSQGSASWNIEDETQPTMVPAPKPGYHNVQVPISTDAISCDEHHGTGITQRRRYGKGNLRYKPGQPQRAIMRATAAATGLPGARAFSFGCTCGMEHDVSFSMVIVAITVIFLVLLFLFKLTTWVRESPLTRKLIHQVPEENLAARIFICSDHPRSNHSYLVYESCHGLANSKGMAKSAEICKVCAKSFAES